MKMPSFKKAKIIMQNKTAYVHVPKSWFDYQKRTGNIETKIVKGKTEYYLDMIIDKEITLKATRKTDISISQ